MPQYAWSIHCTENCLQLSNNPLVYLRSTPGMEPLGAQRCSTRTDIVSTYLTRDLWSVKIPRLKESAPLGAHLNQMKGEYALVWISDVQPKDESNILNELSPNPKIHQTSICQARERPNASKSIFHKREHSNDHTSTNLQKSVQVKTVKDNVWSHGLRVVLRHGT